MKSHSVHRVLFYLMRRLVLAPLAWIAFAQSVAYAQDTPPLLSDALPAPIELRVRALLKSPGLLASQQLASRVTFESAESTHADGIPTINAVNLVQGNGLDVWLMRQERVFTSPQARARMSSLAAKDRKEIEARPVFHVGIVVDTKVTPHLAFYLEFNAGFEWPNTKKGVPDLAPFSVACVRCHPSGPRVMRPQASLAVPALTRDKRALLALWNARIAAYGVVKTHFPEQTTRSRLGRLVPDDPQSYVPVTNTECVGCHADASGVRSALLEMHRPTMDFLTGHGRNLEGDIVPLQAGSGGGGGGGQAPEMPFWDQVAAQPVPTKTRWTLDAGSELSIKVPTTVGHFEIEELPVAGELTCELETCGGVFNVTLDLARTGIDLRDAHLHARVLQSARFPMARVEAAQCPLTLGTTHECLVKISWRGLHHKVKAMVHTKRIGQGIDVSLDVIELALKDFEIQPPAFLAVRVLESVQVSGVLKLRKRH